LKTSGRQPKKKKGRHGLMGGGLPRTYTFQMKRDGTDNPKTEVKKGWRGGAFKSTFGAWPPVDGMNETQSG